MTTTIYSLLRADLAKIQKECAECAPPCVEVRGSCQFINYVKQNVNETLGVPTRITNRGGYTEVSVYKVARFRLIGDTTIETGYTMKLI